MESMKETLDFRSLPIQEMESIVARFEERVNLAQQNSPPSKQWVREAIHRRGSGRCPARLKRLSIDVIVRYGDALADLFCEFPDDAIGIIPYDFSIGYQSPDKSSRINTIEALMRDAHMDRRVGERNGGMHTAGWGATPTDHPLRDWAMLDDYLARQMPSALAPGRLATSAPIARMHGATKYCFGCIHLSLFERLQSLRGMENLFMDFYTNEAELRRLMDAIVSYLLELIRSWAELGVDGIFMGDDWGTQTGLMISPDLWRQYFKSYYKTLFGEMHRLGLDSILHSCGNVMAIVGELIDCGLDVLDPIQPGAMDIDALAREYGGKISFKGAIDVQDLLCNGSPQEIKDSIRRIMDTLGRPYGGGLMIGSANVITPEVPLENLRAMFEVCHER